MKHLIQLLKFIPLFLLIWFTIVSCNAAKNAPVSGDVVSLSALAKKHARYAGKEIQLEGVYLGWKHDACRFPKSFCPLQVTRSDWTISNGKWCCFVTGGIPDGLNTAPETPVSIKLTARVKSKDAKIYLEYISSQLIK